MNRLRLLEIGLALGFVLLGGANVLAAGPAVYPGKHWETRDPEAVGLSREKLIALTNLAGGRGCVVRHGCLVFTWGDASKSAEVASALKPVVSTLLFLAIQEGRLAGVDSRVSDFDPRLLSLADGKNAAITWRQLASQTSGYGLSEPPGAAYSYNDYALALYYDTLTTKVFGTNGTDLLRTRLAEPLQFDDRSTFDAFGPQDRPGRLALSVRDFARFGLLYLRGGKWRDQQLLKPELVAMAINSPISARTPLTSAAEAPMLPGQRSLGGTRNITPVGPGFYSFNWWLNRTNGLGQRLFVDAPPDTFVAGGHGGKRMLWLFPSLDLIVSWNDSRIDDHDRSPGNPDSLCNQAARLIVAAVNARDARAAPPPAQTVLGIDGPRFAVNGKPVFLTGISYYGALGAPDAFIRADLAEMQQVGVNWIRVWATWGAFSNEVSAVDAEGHPREPFLPKLRQLISVCDDRGMVVDVTLSRGNGGTGPVRLQSHEAHRRAVETLVTALRPYRNWYLDLSNERNIRDKRFTSFDDLKDLRVLVRELDPARLVTASHAGDPTRDEVRQYVETVRVDFLSPHRPRDAGSASQTAAKTEEFAAWMKADGHVVLIHYQEPFRRGYGSWQPAAIDFVTDFRQARQGGAAGWCFHNGDQRDAPGSRPPRSFDLREKRLFDQLDAEERKTVEELRRLLAFP
jgi:CubicO group peptidase (beta-lactamase class C family)